MKITKIVVANRGEIALRVMRSAREMGIKTVAVFSEADRNALHVRYADESVCIGPAASSESYLRGEKIIDVCKKTGAQAIHPGYGFLSENAKFAQMVADAGLIFVGPSPKSIEVMGSKLGAKAAVSHYDIPMVPGTPDAISDIPAAKKRAAEIGYPVLIKASAGGGGKGMRIVENEEEFEEQMQRAISEAISAFGDGSVFIEKYILSPKHIEIQVLGDQHGNVVHLFERECSVQRRHQKVVEEAPSAVLTPAIREAMGLAATNVARACNYYGAGTVEFIVDKDLNFYFLEMNTRLQVEHPVTEQISGVDLVKEQIKIAQGEPLSFKQEDLKILGHAVEVRVYAEDPKNNFLPDIGRLQTYIRPQGVGVRVDDGFEQGMEIPIYYDPMIAKLTTFGKDRTEAIARMIRAIDEYQITGIETTLGFCRFVMEHPAFVDGSFGTDFVNKYFTPEVLQAPADAEELEVAAIFAGMLAETKKPKTAAAQTVVAEKRGSAWKQNRTR
ncbi:acetyl-CoA carboxylase, biotin carboxylase subunit [Flexibacter flexilis DSM 6793]|uniref:Acetyl-CoA carboxylase, biotin carboxylase subunit n=1 Tax=Flexibacter flexilis DSM 6793 TaxID=927664 RepID=A0A1I1NPT6_9BACT|nr:acetyl-CoA carboxylase biotin carboxylase subunit [Flexibacter flexilis]SFC99292.1 acetyl-CoA carboxylase, biotin carboxylase subunit [Flexibacter flexilis DSM 6793]